MGSTRPNRVLINGNWGPTWGVRGDKLGYAWGKGARAKKRPSRGQANKPSKVKANKEPTQAPGVYKIADNLPL